MQSKGHWHCFSALIFMKSEWKKNSTECVLTGVGLVQCPPASPVYVFLNITNFFTFFVVCLVCGKPYNDRTLIVRGNRTKKGDYPWQVALYRATTKKFLCGGTLLNERVILTGKFGHSD